jgi:hypothetical protein
MKRVLSLAAATLLAGTLFSPAFAQAINPGQPPAVTGSNPPNINQRELGNYDKFADSHPEVAQRLSKNPGLVDNPQFMSKHPEFSEFLKNHPGVRTQFKEHPERFSKRERRFEHRERRHRDRDDWRHRDRDDRGRDQH